METKRVNLVFLFSILIYLGGANVIALFFPAVTTNVYCWNVLCELLLLLLPAVWMTAHRYPAAEIFRIRLISGRNVLYSILMLFCFYPVCTLLNYLTSLVGKSASTTIAEELTQGNVFTNFLFFAVVPGIVEELVFRGFLYSTYRKSNAVRALVLSALLFGLMHMNLNQFSYTFVFGMLQVLLLEAADSIISPMIAHMTLNGISVVVASMANLDSMSQSSEVLDLQSSPVFQAAEILYLAVFAVVGLIVGFVCYRKMLAMNGRTQEVLDLFHLTHDERGRLISVSRLNKRNQQRGWQQNSPQQQNWQSGPQQQTWQNGPQQQTWQNGPQQQNWQSSPQQQNWQSGPQQQNWQSGPQQQNWQNGPQQQYWQNGPQQYAQRPDRQDKLITVPLIIVMIICIAMMVLYQISG